MSPCGTSVGPLCGRMNELAKITRALVEVFMVADAGGERQPLEDARRPEEEVVPVSPLVAAVDEVARDEEEAGIRPSRAGGVQELAPLLETALEGLPSPKRRSRDRDRDRFVPGTRGSSPRPSRLRPSSDRPCPAPGRGR